MQAKSKNRIPRDELRSLPTPSPTETWMPVPHDTLVETIENNLFDEGFKVQRSEFATGCNGNVLFGVMDLHRGSEKEIAPSIGIRSSNNNKRFSIQLIVGTRVFVCDNLAFNGEVIALKRRHTSGLQLEAEVKEGLVRFKEKYEAFQADVATQKTIEISDDEAKGVIYEAFQNRCLPTRTFHDVHKSYWQPEHKEFEVGNLWSLNNAFTEVAKKLDDAPRFRSLISLGALIGRVQKMKLEGATPTTA